MVVLSGLALLVGGIGLLRRRARAGLTARLLDPTADGALTDTDRHTARLLDSQFLSGARRQDMVNDWLARRAKLLLLWGELDAARAQVQVVDDRGRPFEGTSLHEVEVLCCLVEGRLELAGIALSRFEAAMEAGIMTPVFASRTASLRRQYEATCGNELALRELEGAKAPAGWPALWRAHALARGFETAGDSARASEYRQLLKETAPHLPAVPSARPIRRPLLRVPPALHGGWTVNKISLLVTVAIVVGIVLYRIVEHYWL